MPKPYPREFRDDVVRVARDRGPGVTVEQVAKDFGVHPMTLFKWLRAADVEDGARPGVIRTESADGYRFLVDEAKAAGQVMAERTA